MNAPFPLSKDGFLKQQIHLFQPQKGYRVAIDPVFLAASVPTREGESVLDVGCGVGALSCFLFLREPSLHVTGIEQNPAILNLAIENHKLNGFGEAFNPVLAQVENLGLSQQFDHVISNPPYYPERAHTLASTSLKAEAHQETISLQSWIFQALRHLKLGGYISLILPPARLGDFIQATDGKLALLKIFPLWPKKNQEARRVILQGQKRGKGGEKTRDIKMLPGLVLHQENGTYTEEAEAILTGARLPLTP